MCNGKHPTTKHGHSRKKAVFYDYPTKIGPKDEPTDGGKHWYRKVTNKSAIAEELKVSKSGWGGCSFPTRSSQNLIRLTSANADNEENVCH